MGARSGRRACSRSRTCPRFELEPCDLVVEGPTLAERIAQGPVPWRDALAIARQIADVLDAAHAHGVVHRDLKPANIKLTSDGQVKVLDFGLAKAVQTEGGSAGPEGPAYTDAANSPTLTARLHPGFGEAGTQMGMILGTAAYMAPQQARGRPVDKRADVWAFGCVLYMVTGRRLFAGEDLTETLASVVKEEPDLSAAPVEVRRLLKRCLEKDPKKRLRDIGGAWDLLDDRATTTTPATTRASASMAVPWMLAAVGLVAAGLLAFVHFRETPTIPPATQFQVSWPVGAAGAAGGGRFFALSPDGRHLAIVSQHVIWVRSLNEVDPGLCRRPPPGTWRPIMAVPVSSGAGGSFQNGAPRALFGSIPTVGNVHRFTCQPSADGQRFLVALPVEASAKPMTVVLNWQQALQR